MMHFDEWLRELAYTDFPDELFRPGGRAGASPYAAEIEEMLSEDGGIAASAVFCVEELPTVCVVDPSKFSTDRDTRIEQIRQRVWNQNLVSVVLVLDPEQLTAYSVANRTTSTEILRPSEADRYGRWSAYEIQSGFIKDRLSSWFDPDERVDQRLLRNLREVVRQLTRGNLTTTQSEALMAQVIFVCYLEQRGIIGDAYRKKHRLELLNTYVHRCDGAGVDRLLTRLGRDFNGDFLSSTDGGARSWSTLRRRSFQLIAEFLSAVDLDTGQGLFWHYDFSRIPVELISGIYETLLKDRQGALGAYYTPRHLANLVVDQAFEVFDDPTLCSVYDGACGSGILLTTAFRRMLRHAEFAQGQTLRLTDRISLMRKNLFGNDIDETACWITAFSLCLSLLEGLDPSDIWLLQSDENVTLPRLIGPNLNIQKGERRGDFFSEHNPFAGKRKFDVFLCNPPWRESTDREIATWEEWCKQQPVPYPIGRRQIAAGFAYRASQSVRNDGTIALIMPLNLVIGATPQSCEFRQRWLADVRIERIINFGDVRRLLFPAADHPCAVVRVRPRVDIESEIPLSDEVIEYWTPKADVSLALGRLSLHTTDRKTLSARDVAEEPYVLISNYWGDPRDLDLLRRLKRFGSLKATMDARPHRWLSGKGFHAANKSNPDRELGILRDLKFLPAERLPTAYPIISRDAQLQKVRDIFRIVASPGGKNGQLYQGPRVLFPDGLIDGHAIRAVYSDVPFAFQSSVAAVGGGATKDADLLKFLTVYLRSPLASYLMIMTGYSVISERPRVAVDDIERLPFCSPDRHPDPIRATDIIHQVATIIDKIADVAEWQREHPYAQRREELFNHIFDYFCLTKADRVLVDETVKYIAPSIQPADYGRLSTPLLARPTQGEIGQYANALASELTNWRERRRGKGSLSIAAIIAGRNDFFGAVRVTTDQDQEDDVEVVSSARRFSSLLTELQEGMERQIAESDPESLFRIPNMLVLVGDVFYFVKPLRRRFWMVKTALSDADQIARTVQAAAWKLALS
jgi:Eco57I restriction-modification methylase